MSFIDYYQRHLDTAKRQATTALRREPPTDGTLVGETQDGELVVLPPTRYTPDKPGRVDVLLLPNLDLALVQNRRGLTICTDLGDYNLIDLIAMETLDPQSPVRTATVRAAEVQEYRRILANSRLSGDNLATHQAAPLYKLVALNVLDAQDVRYVLGLGPITPLLPGYDRRTVLRRMGFRDPDAIIRHLPPEPRLATATTTATATAKARKLPPMIPEIRKRRILPCQSRTTTPANG